MTDQELKDLVASLAVEHKKTELMMQETADRQKETDRMIKELSRRLAMKCWIEQAAMALA